MRIAVLVSGGVDSSVALRLLKDAGHTVTAFYLKIWLEDELAFLGECPWEEDLQYVRAVCEEADVPLEVVPFQKEYWEQVVAYVIAEVRAGRTPNPDMLCNARIKFGAFYDFLNEQTPPQPSPRKACPSDRRGEEVREKSSGMGGFDKIATGHYAQTEAMLVTPHGSNDFLFRNNPSVRRNGQLPFSKRGAGEQEEDGMSEQMVTLLRMSPDPVKDQTYFLSQLTQAQVSKALFPIGHLKKTEVRVLAEKFQLPNAKRKDSQGICFLGKIPFDQFLEYHLGKRPGKLIEAGTERILGEHNGFWYFTIGQRQGIGLSGGPWYVVSKNPETNDVFVSHQAQYGLAARDSFVVGGLNWIAGVAPEKKELQVKIRHGEKMYLADIEYGVDGTVKVSLKEKDSGVAAGQFAVFYNGDVCLGGGVIQ